MKIYNELESLGFFEWLKEKGFGSGFTPIILDAQPIDSIERSGYNAIAFRWFREKYKLYSHVRESYSFDNTLEFVTQINGSYVNHGIVDKPINRFETYEEAELECLKKLIEIANGNNN